MQRLLLQQCLAPSSCAPPASLSELVRLLTCPTHARALHSSVAPHKQPPSLSDDEEPQAADEDLVATGSETDDASLSGDDAEGSTSSSTSSQGAAAAAAAAERQRLPAVDETAVYLKYNWQFTTDPDRWYAIGRLASEDKRTRLELRKALAAHRLRLQDAASAAAAEGRRQPSLTQQINSRLADMQNYISSPTWR